MVSNSNEKVDLYHSKMSSNIYLLFLTTGLDEHANDIVEMAKAHCQLIVISKWDFTRNWQIYSQLCLVIIVVAYHVYLFYIK